MLAALAHTAARGGDAAIPAPARWGAALLALATAGWTAHATWREPAAARPRDADPSWRAALVVLLGALLIADAAWDAEARCLAALADPSVPLMLRLEAPAAPRSWLRAEARAVSARSAPVAPEARRALRRCRVAATVSVRDGEAAAGDWVRVEARRRLAGRTLRLDEAELRPTGRTDRVHGWRGRTGLVVDALFRDRAPLARALLVADQHGIDAGVRDRYADAGLVHLLSVSGLHVAIIAGALRTLAAALRLPRAAGDPLALLGVAAYVLLLGLPAPAVRAAAMLAVVTMTGGLGRPVHPWTALALGVALPTVDPRVVADLGWQFSASGMAALVGARSLLRRWRTWPLMRPPLAGPSTAGGGAIARVAWRLRLAGPRLDGWRLLLARELVVGVLASAVSAPLVAWTFGRVSLVAPLANVLAAPVVTLLQPALFLALVLGLPGESLRPLAQWVADASVVPLHALDLLATASARVPFAALSVAPGVVTACCTGGLMAAIVLATARRRVLPPLLGGVGALVVALWWPALARGPGRLELHLIDVGQGDAIALRTPHGRWILVDAGRTWRGGDAGRRLVVPYVRRRGGDVALFVLSHPDADHVGGAPSVLAALRPAAWWDPGFVHGSDVYRESLDIAARLGIPWRRARTGDSLRVDGVLLRVLGPDSAWTAAQASANDASTVLLVQHGRVRLLLTGDAEAAQESWLVDRWGEALAATVLKVGHHGSRTSSTPAFLDAVRPRVAVISVGADNRYGHPAPDVLAALRARDVEILRTDRDGAIVLRSDGRRLALETRLARWSLDVP